MSFKNKLVYAFNMFFLEFLNDVKKQNEDLRKIIRTHYKIFEKNSHVHFERVKESVNANTQENMVEMLPEKTCDDICNLLESENDKAVIKSYLYIFLSLVRISDEEECETSISILEKVLEIVKGIQEGRDVEDDMKEILDDSISSHLAKLRDCMGHRKTESGNETDQLLGMLENSKIGSLAKEISNEIDLKDLDISNPEQLLDFRNLTNSNNVLGSIISKVGGKIKNKIDSGELSQTDLVKEAMSFVGMVNGGGAGGNSGGGFDFMSMLNNPMFGDLLSGLNMGGGAGNNVGGASSSGSGTRVQVDRQKVSNMQTRDRLRRKLQERQKDKSTESQD
jgi:hypothetical protein